MPKFFALRELVDSGGNQFPVFIGFLSADEIIKISAAPAFTEKTHHEALAQIVLTPPVRDWQRPLNQDRVSSIANTFSHAGELMPNPVLLSENVLESHNIKITQHLAPGGSPTPAWEIEIMPSSGSQSKPLWILDGQHRINGMAQSTQNNEPIPFVLLLNSKDGNFYAGTTLAKVFAQVTTSAEKLDELHNEWLTFAFDLDVYSHSNPNHNQHHDAMKCIANLCKTPIVAGLPNPFYNEVQFNHFLKSINPSPGGFSFTCKELKEITYKAYYSLHAPVGHLPPTVLAEEMVLAHRALVKVVTNPKNSVFFGDKAHDQKIMQEAFWIGTFSYLRKHGKPSDWEVILKTLNFDKTNWDFKSWVLSLHGKVGSASKRLAANVFAHVFEKNSLPPGVSNLANFLKGDKASAEFTFSKLTPAMKISNVGRFSQDLDRGSVDSVTLTGHLSIKAKSKNLNIINLDITDKQSPPGKLVTYHEMTSGKGLLLDTAKHSNPLLILVQFNFYGGLSASAELDINW